MKKKYFLIAVITIILFGCNNSKKEDIKYEKVVEKEFHPFFDSDEIDHYYVNYTLKNVLDFIDKDRTSKRNKEFSGLFMGYFPDSIPKKNFEEILFSHNYKKSNLTIKQQKRN